MASRERIEWQEPIMKIADQIDALVVAAVTAEREACAAEMDRRAVQNANTPDTQAAYRNAANAIRSRD